MTDTVRLDVRADVGADAAGSARGIRTARAIFRAGAVSNFAVTVPAFVAYKRYVRTFTTEEPNYPFLVWIWSGMAFLWGVMFWEIGGAPEARAPMVKYAIAEKAVTTTAVTVAYRTGNVPRRFLVSILFTDLLWIPLFGWALRRIRAGQQ
jgi:hypothetical protein